jgi:hypothetical protein
MEAYAIGSRRVEPKGGAHYGKILSSVSHPETWRSVLNQVMLFSK